MKRQFAIVFLFLVLASGSWANTFKMDGPTPLKLVHDRGDGLSKFKGNVTITGRFIARWESDADENLHLFTAIRPTAVSAGVLPYDAIRGPVREVWLYDNGKLLLRLLGADVKRDLMTRRISSVEVEAQVTITGYQSAIDCDFRSYAARIVSGKALSSAEVAKAPYKKRGC